VGLSNVSLQQMQLLETSRMQQLLSSIKAMIALRMSLPKALSETVLVSHAFACVGLPV
jgi:hypothetical protein